MLIVVAVVVGTSVCCREWNTVIIPMNIHIVNIAGIRGNVSYLGGRKFVKSLSEILVISK